MTVCVAASNSRTYRQTDSTFVFFTSYRSYETASAWRPPQKWDFCDVFPNCDIRDSGVFQPNWHVIGSHVLSQWGAGCFFHSQLLCAKHADPTDGNIVPFVPQNRLVGAASARYRRFDKHSEKKLPSKTSVGDDNVTNCCHGDLLFEITSKNSMCLVEGE